MASRLHLGRAAGRRFGRPGSRRGSSGPATLPVNTVAPVISGTRGGTLTATPGTWTGTPTLTYQWQRFIGGAWADITGATATTFVDDDASIVTSIYDVRARETATNAAGTATANSNTLAAWTPASDTNARLWWKPTDLSDGAVSSWTDAIGAVAATQTTGTKQPSKSATAISSAYPGVAYDGGDVLEAAVGGVVGGDSVVTLVCVLVDAINTATVIFEHGGAPGSTNGSLSLQSGVGTTLLSVRGTVGVTTKTITETLAAAVVLSVVVDLSVAGAGAIVAMRVNGVSQSMTTTASSSAAGTVASASFWMGGRGATPTSPWTGTHGPVLWRESATAGANLLRAERYVGLQAGITF